MRRVIPQAVVLLAAACGPSGAPVPSTPVTAPSAAASASAVPAAPDRTADQTLDNLVAFAKLLGYVRHFHPSDEAAVADWESLTIAAVPRVEQARTPGELARVLSDVFRPVAPTLRVYTSGTTPETPAELVRPAGTPRLGWVHHGYGPGAVSPAYRSDRVPSDRIVRREPAVLSHEIDAPLVSGHKVHLRGSLRAEPSEEGGTATLFVAQDGPGVSRMDKSRPVTSAEWSDVELAVDVDPKAMIVTVGLSFEGGGRAFVDDVSLAVEGAKTKVPLGDAGFERAAPGTLPDDWDADVASPEFRASVTTEKPHGGKRCAGIVTSPVAPETFPDPADVFRAPLGAGVEAAVPLSLHLDSQRRTVPAAAVVPQLPAEPASSRLLRVRALDRSVRMADVILAWNVVQHFFPHFDVVKADWPAELRRALTKADGDADEWAFHRTLQLMVAALHDGHADISRTMIDPPKPGGGGSGALPIALAIVEGKLTITRVAPGVSEVRPGDVITRFGVKTAEETLDSYREVMSAATPQWVDYRATSEMVWGRKDKDVVLGLSRAGSAPFEATLHRGAPPPVEDPRPAAVAELEPGIAYVDIGRVDDARWIASLPMLAKARGIVFDLRGYPAGSPRPLGHLIDRVVTTGQSWVPKITRPDHRDMTFERAAPTRLHPRTPRLHGKVAFVTDGRAMSYSETYLGVVEAYRLGAIVGGPTAGTNGDIERVALPGGYGFSFTGQRALKHDGTRLHGVGIVPTVPCARTIAGVAVGKDELLECGIHAVR